MFLKTFLVVSAIMILSARLVYCDRIAPAATAALKQAIASQAVSPTEGYECPAWPPCRMYFYGKLFGTEYSAPCWTNPTWKNQVIECFRSFPSCYTVDPRTTLSSNGGTMPAASVVSWLAASGAPEEFQEAAKLVVFTPSEEYVSIYTSINPGTGTGQEVIGVANNVAGQVTIAYADASVITSLIPKYQTITKRVCDSCWWVATCCHNEEVTVPRGYTPGEVQGIIQTLRAFMYETMAQQIGEFSMTVTEKTGTFLTQLSHNTGNFTKKLTKALGSWWTQIPKFIHAFDSSSWTKMQQVKKLGFTTLREMTKAMKLMGVPAGHEQDIVNDAIQMGLMPDNTGLINLLTNLAPWMAEDFTYVMTSATWSNNGAMANTIVFLGIDQVTKKQDWFIMVTQCSFTLAPDTIIVTQKTSILGGLWSDTKMYYKYTPHVLTAADIKTISLLFEITTVSMISDMFGIKYVFPALPGA